MTILPDEKFPIYYDLVGQGEPLLLISGMAATNKWFHYNIPAFLSAGYQVVAQDMRGSFRPGIPPAGGNYTTEDMASDTIRLLDALNIERTKIVGLSMGGMIAQILAVKHPDRVSKVSIVGNGLAKTPHEVILAATKKDPDDPVGKMYAIEGLSPEQMLQNAIDLVFTPGFQEKHPEKFSYWLNEIHHAYPESVASQAQAAFRHDTLEQLEKIKCPFQILVGDLDIVNRRYAPQMVEKIPNCEFKVLKGMNHGLNLEFSDEYNLEVLNFLAPNPSTSSI